MENRRLALLAVVVGLFGSPLCGQLPKGTEIRIDRTPSGFEIADVAVASNGDFVAVWRDGRSLDDPSNVLLRLYAADGKARTGPIRVSGAEAGRQFDPSIAANARGDFVVVWTVDPTATLPGGVFGRRFAADGRPRAGRFRVADAGGRPDVALAPDGSFMVVWTAPDGGVNTTDVFARRFGASGAPLGAKFRVNLTTFEEQTAARIAGNARGDFVVVWESFRDAYNVVARQFSASGAPRSGEINVTNSEVYEIDAAVALADDGRFLVVWTSFAGDPQIPDGDPFYDTRGVMGALYTADGVPAGPTFDVNDFTRGAQDTPAVSTTRGGGFLVTWTSGGDQDGDRTGIFARRYAPDGSRRGPEFRVNLKRTAFQSMPSVAVAANGKGVVAWTSSNPATGIWGIFARRLEPPR